MTALHSDGRYLLYGLLDNRADDHDLRFLGCTDDVPAAVEELGDAHAAYLGFNRDTAIQWEPGIRVIDGVAAVVAIGTGQAKGWVHGV